MRKKPVFKCPECGAKPTELVEIGVNCDIVKVRGELLDTIGEEAGFFFCPKCHKEQGKGNCRVTSAF